MINSKYIKNTAVPAKIFIFAGLVFFSICAQFFAQTSDEVSELFKDGKGKYLKSNLNGAISVWEYALQLDNSDSKIKSAVVNALVIRAKNQCRNANYEGSLSSIRKAIEYSPENNDLRFIEEKIKEIFAFSVKNNTAEVPKEYLAYLDTSKESAKISEIIGPEGNGKKEVKEQNKKPREEKIPPENAKKEKIVRKKQAEPAKIKEDPPKAIKPRPKTEQPQPPLLAQPTVQVSQEISSAAVSPAQEAPQAVEQVNDEISIAGFHARKTLLKAAGLFIAGILLLVLLFVVFRKKRTPGGGSIKIEDKEILKEKSPAPGNVVDEIITETKKEIIIDKEMFVPDRSPVAESMGPEERIKEIEEISEQIMDKKTDEDILKNLGLAEIQGNKTADEKTDKEIETKTESATEKTVGPETPVKAEAGEAVLPARLLQSVKIEQAVKEYFAGETSRNLDNEILLAKNILKLEKEIAYISLFDSLRLAGASEKEKIIDVVLDCMAESCPIAIYRLIENLLNGLETQDKQAIVNRVFNKVQDSPRDSRRLYVMGVVCVALGFYDEALSSFTEAASQNSGNTDAFMASAILHMKKENFDEAFSFLSKIEGRVNKELYPNIIAGLNHAKKGNTGEARAHWKKETEINVEQAEQLLTLGKFAVGQGLFLEALENYMKAIEFNPRNSVVYYLLGIAYLSKELFNESRVYLRHAFLLNYFQPELYNALAVLYYFESKSEISKTIWETVQSSNQGNKIAAYARANNEKLALGKPLKVADFRI